LISIAKKQPNHNSERQHGSGRENRYRSGHGCLSISIQLFQLFQFGHASAGWRATGRLEVTVLTMW
jgi:hypothetical protein